MVAVLRHRLQKITVEEFEGGSRTKSLQHDRERQLPSVEDGGTR